jgi:hypothetical protein
MENLGIFYDHLVYFTIFWPFGLFYYFWPFGIYCGNLVYFPPFWYFVPRKIWQPCNATDATLKVVSHYLHTLPTGIK